MNLVDVCIAILLVIFALRGWRRGLFRTLIGLVGFFVAALAAISYLKSASDLIMRYLQVPAKVAEVFSFIGIFVVVLLLFRILGFILYKAIHFTPIGFIDSLGGIALGLLKGGFIVSVALLLLSLVPLPPKWQMEIGTSTLAEPMRGVAPYVFNKVKKGLLEDLHIEPPKQIPPGLEESYRDLEKALHPLSPDSLDPNVSPESGLK
ncbi:MAG TPA: CvpA family protein [Candidatus Latescibacteria bacterium]|nr:CvpA family protein [Candidatus Latescibacterota bacterium]